MRRRVLAGFTFLPLLAGAVAVAGCGTNKAATTQTAQGKPGPTPTPTPSGTGRMVDIWLTTGDGNTLLSKQPQVEIFSGAASAGATTVDPAQTYQTMVGFGAAMTDASAYVLRHEMTTTQRQALMTDLFGSTGASFSFIRVPLGASDFSRTFYSFNDMPSGQSDPTLANFSIAAARTDIIPALAEAQQYNASITFMGTPWSAPGWMKSSGSLITGTLNNSAYPAYANYLAKTVDAFAADGVKLSYLSIQNEPDFEPADYPGMRLSAAQRANLIGNHIGPALVGKNVKILDWDHNWDKPDQPIAVLGDAVASQYVAGAAWHCYGGDVAAQTTVHNQFPGKETFFTECTGTGTGGQWPGSLEWNMKNIMIGATRGWASGVALWNLALDENSGPHLGGCNDCRGVVTVNSQTGAVTKNVEYWVLSHLSRFVKPGAKRIFSDQPQRNVINVAFANPDGGKVMLMFNANQTDQSVNVAIPGEFFTVTVPKKSAITVSWR